MNIFAGQLPISGIYAGSEKISKIYVGSNLVFTDTPPPSSGNVPGIPQNLIASIGDSYISLNWDEPNSTGDSPISSYIIEYETV